MNLLKDFKPPLTKLEKLMICNNPPESVLQFSLVIEICLRLHVMELCLIDCLFCLKIVKDLEEKLEESEIQDWLNKINKVMK